jgi:hypothetical protein
MFRSCAWRSDNIEWMEDPASGDDVSHAAAAEARPPPVSTGGGGGSGLGVGGAACLPTPPTPRTALGTTGVSSSKGSTAIERQPLEAPPTAEALSSLPSLDCSIGSCELMLQEEYKEGKCEAVATKCASYDGRVTTLVRSPPPLLKLLQDAARCFCLPLCAVDATMGAGA